MKSLFSLILIILMSCSNKENYYNIPTYKDGVLQAVIEIPAGTTIKYELDENSNTFLPDRSSGKDRRIKFLGYPGNYGFIPSTYSDPALGGDGDALDILVLSDSAATGSVLSVIPIGMLKLIDAGELDYKIIAVPVAKKDRQIDVEDFRTFSTDYKAALYIIEIWFSNYETEDIVELEGWGDEKEALGEIKKWMRTSKN